jgi:hypothetical protein
MAAGVLLLGMSRQAVGLRKLIPGPQSGPICAGWILAMICWRRNANNIAPPSAWQLGVVFTP